MSDEERPRRKGWDNHRFLVKKKATQAPRLSMGACTHCRTMLWRDMTSAMLEKHLQGHCTPKENPHE